MAYLVIITVTLIITAVMLLWPRLGDSANAEGEVRADAEKAAPTTLEGVLAAQLVGGEISQDQYRNALARLAERDDERNPMSVPGNDRPGACA
ncbi:hypothetical protein AB0F81_13200 [Actinoplanes sp. NPDC024001]|uniref:hypothetical protein n=1 Tax=Actinoplanes sp. NPDC024001 TaxID=3154598 RepID=UPI0033C6EC5C